MPKINVIRAWKDAEYRASLSASELASLPANPAGPMELRDDQLEMAAGGGSFSPRCTSCCNCPDTSTIATSCCTA